LDDYHHNIISVLVTQVIGNIKYNLLNQLDYLIM
jgi:hypothetical protein